MPEMLEPRLEPVEMIHVNLIADRGPSFSSFTPSFLSDIESGEPRPTCSRNVTSTYLYAAPHTSVLSSTASVPKGPLNPLRLIVSRVPRYEVSWFDCTERLAYFMDTLECGHQVIIYAEPFTDHPAFPSGNKRHRCAQCAKALSQRKPVRSVKPNKKAKAGAA